jgi:hypothetical protein
MDCSSYLKAQTNKETLAASDFVVSLHVSSA